MRKTSAVGLFVMLNSVFIGFQGIVHGISEILKGNVPTGGMLLADVGAITLIQNYLLTGILTVTAGIIIIILALFFTGRQFYVPLFALLCASLFATGGGVGFIVFFIFAFIAALQVNRPFGFVANMVSGKAGEVLKKYNTLLMCLAFGFALTGMLIWLFFLTPGEMHTGDKLQYVCWLCLCLGLVLYFPALFSCHAKDLIKGN